MNRKSKQSSKEWKRVDSPPSTKLKQETSIGKVLFSVFWDHKGIILKRSTPTGVTITKTYYYANISMNKLHLDIRKQRRGLISGGVILHHDNAPIHTSHLVSSTIHNLKYESASSSTLFSISGTLAPSDYFFVSCFKRLSQRKTLQWSKFIRFVNTSVSEQYDWRWLYSCYTKTSRTLTKVSFGRRNDTSRKSHIH